MSQLSFEEAFKFLTLDELKATVPSAFTNVAMKSTSDYIVIPTPEVLLGLNQFGWKVSEAYQAKPKKDENRGFQKHYIYLRNETSFIGERDDIELVPEILIVNSYDAKCSFKMFQGMYRSISKSHLIFSSESMPPTVIPHKGFHAEITGALATKFLNDTNRTKQIIDQMRGKVLTPIEQKKFAQECCRARWDYTFNLPNYSEILAPSREEDEGNDVWSLYNRVQEKVLQGGWKGNGGKAIKKLVEPIRELKVRQRITQIAQDFAQI